MSQLTPEEKTFLLRLARRSLEASVRGSTAELPEGIPAALKTPGSAFVTLRKHSSLRGCVGFVPARKPLFETVMEAAAGAALNDKRFPPVTPSELPELEVEISVLSPAGEVRPEEIQIGVHGLLVTEGSAHGLLLPQVAVDRDWTALKFLEETCRKAGLPPDAWRRNAKVEAFTATVFSECALDALPN